MGHIQYTLVTDGPSDRLLQHPLEWLLERLTALDFDGEWANPEVFGKSDAAGLYGRIAQALDYYPCQLLFVHRDAEREPHKTRVAEIEDAVARLSCPPPAVCLVPVRMTETWLLIDEPAMRQAAGNPNGRNELSLPAIKELENLPNPKQRLFDLLKEASGLPKRRLRRFRERQARQRVAELINDYSALGGLTASQAFRGQLERILEENGWT